METLAHLRVDQSSLYLLDYLEQGPEHSALRPRIPKAGSAAFVSLSSRMTNPCPTARRLCRPSQQGVVSGLVAQLVRARA